MVNLHPALPAAPWAMPARAQAPVETAEAVRPVEASLRIRGEALAEPGGWARVEAAYQERPDPEAPVGPPPAFRANVLEAERARLSDPRAPASERPREAARTGAPDRPEADTATVRGDPADPAVLPAYREARFGGGPARIDLIR